MLSYVYGTVGISNDYQKLLAVEHGLFSYVLWRITEPYHSQATPPKTFSSYLPYSAQPAKHNAFKTLAHRKCTFTDSRDAVRNIDSRYAAALEAPFPDRLQLAIFLEQHFFEFLASVERLRSDFSDTGRNDHTLDSCLRKPAISHLRDSFWNYNFLQSAQVPTRHVPRNR